MEEITKEIRITARDKANLTTAAKWARFLAIISFVMLGLAAGAMLFGILAIAVAGVSVPSSALPAGGSIFAIVYLVVMLAVMLIAFLPALYLYRFADKALEAVAADDQEAMSESTANLRRYFKFNGIMTLVVIVLYLLIIIAFLIGALLGEKIMPV